MTTNTALVETKRGTLCNADDRPRMALRTLAVDFNSFVASCEQQERPELRGKPVGIVPVLAETTCCIAASYAAKARGVTMVGTGMAEAPRPLPGHRHRAAEAGGLNLSSSLHRKPSQ